MPSSIRNGRSATVPGSNTVSMWPISRARGPPAWPSNVAMTVDPSRPAGSGRRSMVAPSSVANSATQRPTASTPSAV